MKQSKVIILSEIYYPEKTSTGYYLTKIAEGIAQNYKIEVICGPATRNFQRVDALTCETINGVKINRCSGTVFNKDNLVGRLLNLITKTLSIFIKAFCLIQNNDQILVVTNPPSLPLIALILKHIKKCDFTLLVHDVYPEALIAAQILPPKTLPTLIIGALSQSTYRNAKKIITLGRDMESLAKKKLYQDQYDKVSIIPNWADHHNIELIPKSDNQLLKKLKITQHFVILYAGNMGRTHDLEIILNASIQLGSTPTPNQPISFLFIGHGAKRQWLEKEIQQQKLSNVYIYSYLPESERNTAITACDVAIIAFLSGMAGVSVPSRMYNQMAAGKPIIAIADEWSELAQVIQEENIGWVVEPGNMGQFIKTIQNAQANPDLLKAMGQRAQNAVSAKYTYPHILKLYFNLFAEISSSNEHGLLPP